MLYSVHVVISMNVNADTPEEAVDWARLEMYRLHENVWDEYLEDADWKAYCKE
jgi:hypothetical protein